MSASELECGGYLAGLIYGAILLGGTGPGRNLLSFLAWELEFSKDYDLYLPRITWLLFPNIAIPKFTCQHRLI